MERNTGSKVDEPYDPMVLRRYLTVELVLVAWLNTPVTPSSTSVIWDLGTPTSLVHGIYNQDRHHVMYVIDR
jgi:hypothetical protein